MIMGKIHFSDTLFAELEAAVTVDESYMLENILLQIIIISRSRKLNACIAYTHTTCSYSMCMVTVHRTHQAAPVRRMTENSTEKRSRTQTTIGKKHA